METETGLILGTMLIPHEGHKYLMNFARSFGIEVHAVISVRSFEPRLTLDRVNHLKLYNNDDYLHIHEHYDDNAPQNDDGTDAFWDYWISTIKEVTGVERFDYVFSSEPYGQVLADRIGARHIPVDVNRESFPFSGTMIREDLAGYYKHILPGTQNVLKKNICIYGAESAGKTTMSRWLSGYLYGSFVHEFARQYLETVGRDLTEAKMLDIVRGQYAAMRNAENNLFQIRDTDLLSTIGYYRILGYEIPEELLEKFGETQSHYYIVMNDQIPFEPDPLRYGGHVRERNSDFWIELLEEFGCNYYVVRNTDRGKQHKEVVNAIWDYCEDLREIENFKRD